MLFDIIMLNFYILIFIIIITTFIFIQIINY